MTVELKVPELGESINEVEIGQWLKSEGDAVAEDEPVVELESEKATVALPSPAAGTLARVLKQTGETAAIGEVIGLLEKSVVSTKKKVEKKPASSPEKAHEPPEPSVVSASAAGATATTRPEQRAEPTVVPPTGPKSKEAASVRPEAHLAKEDAGPQAVQEAPGAPTPSESREVRVVRMTPIRRTIAMRLVAAQQTAALLTTFNEIDLAALQALRADLQDQFQARHGVKLGLMPFFVRACLHALAESPALNAEVRGEDIVYHNYYDIGIAVASSKGLVVPVLRNTERMSLAEMERVIADFARRGQENRLTMEELRGGTFTITNGGVFGSLLSTPIVNAPQSGVLGMHAIQDRPVARDGQVTIRPMMYVALTYDHRIVDGREAVTFLRIVKERIEKPTHLLDF